jgi:hypothetical protein
MKKYLLLFILACALVPAAYSRAADIAVSNTQAMAFGKFVAGSGGSVIINESGARSATGDVFLVASGGGAVAQFSVTGDPNVTYAVTLPADDVVTLTIAGGGSTMAVNSFVSNPASTGTLTAGAQTLKVGATLTVGAGQAVGNYSGTFDVIVVYN